MRWWSIPIVIILGWIAFTLSPLWALYGLAHAVQTHDTAYLQENVNFRTLRISLTRQLTAAIRAGSFEMDPRERQKINDAAMTLALPLAESLITPQTVIDLLDDGWPESLDLSEAGNRDGISTGLRIGTLRRLADFYTASEMRGFRTVVITVPPDHQHGPSQFKLRLRLRSWRWRLVEVDLSDALRDHIADSIARAAKRGGDRGASDELRPDQEEKAPNP